MSVVDGGVQLLGNLRARKDKGMAQSDEGSAVGSGRIASSSSNTSDLVSVLARIGSLATLLSVSWWVHSYLGGVAAKPDVLADGSVSTDRLFNWHPVLMTLSFGVCMTEALLAYKAPWQKTYPRPQRKQIHWVSHSAALLFAVLGFLAAWKSHTLKQPPIPNLYSPHSYIGMAALILFLGQYVIGFISYLYPQTALESRVALGPFHRFYGLVVYGTGMAAAAVGLQEKATFLQAFGKKGVYSRFIRLPAVTELLLVATVVLVLYHYAAPHAARRPAVQYTAVAVADEEGGPGST